MKRFWKDSRQSHREARVFKLSRIVAVVKTLPVVRAITDEI